MCMVILKYYIFALCPAVQISACKILFTYFFTNIKKGLDVGLTFFNPEMLAGWFY